MPRPKVGMPVSSLRAIEAAKTADQEDALGHEAFGVILEIMRAHKLPRYIGFRYAAAARVLEERRGKPPIRKETEDPGKANRIYKAEFEDGEGVPLGYDEDRE